MAAPPLQGRARFFETLQTQRATHLRRGECHCDGCHRVLFRPPHGSPGSGSERYVVLHRKHVYGIDCITKYLEDKNTCPTCGEILFVEEVDQDDSLNLRRIYSLQEEQQDYNENKDYEMRDNFRNQWHTLANQRARKWFDGLVTVHIEDYTVFRIRHRRDKHRYPLRLPPEPQIVEAAVLVPRLEALWVKLFWFAIQPITEETGIRARGLKVPCHPLSTLLRDQMVETIERLDGERMPAKLLGMHLDQDFMNHGVTGAMRVLVLEGRAPHGLFILQSYLNEAVLRWFCPRGWTERR